MAPPARFGQAGRRSSSTGPTRSLQASSVVVRVGAMTMSAWQVLSRAAATVGGLPAKGLQAISHRPSARRRYVQPGRAHIAVRGLHRPGRAGLAHALEARLRAAPGVVDAHVNAPLGRVIVRSAATALDLDPVIAVVDEFEHDTGLDEDTFAPAPDPGDWQPIVRQAALLGANLTGFAVAVAGRVGRLPKMTHFVPAVVTLVDNTPAL